MTAARSLEGASEVSFDAIELDFSEDRCALLVDMVDADVLTSGRFSYSVDLSRDSVVVTESLRDFLVVSEGEISLARRESEQPD